MKGYRIDQDIRSQTFARIYVLYGEEHYLIQFYRKKLCDALISPGMEMNLNVFQGAETNVEEVIRLADTLPFFAEHRLIILDNTGLFAKKGQALAEYLPTMPESTVILFVEDGKPDERGKLFKAVKPIGVIQQMKHLERDGLENWIVRSLARSGKQITRSALNELLEDAGTDMQTLKTEMEKLIAYTGERPGIQIEDVKAVTTKQTENRIFAMADAIAMGQTQKALTLLKDLLALKESPAGILSLLINTFSLIYQVRDLREQGFDSATIYQKVPLQQFRVRNAMRQCENLSSGRLRRILTLYADHFEMITTGRMDPVSAVEMAVALSGQMCQPRRVG